MTHSLLLLFVNASALGMSLYILGLLIYIYIYIVHISIKKFLTKVGLQLFQLLASRKSCGRFTGN